MTDNMETNPSPIGAIVDEHSSISHQKDLLKLSKKKMQFLVLFSLLLIIVLATITCICVVKIRKLNNILKTNNKNSDEKIQVLTIQLTSCQQKMSMRNIIIYSYSYIVRKLQSSVYPI